MQCEASVVFLRVRETGKRRKSHSNLRECGKAKKMEESSKVEVCFSSRSLQTNTNSLQIGRRPRDTARGTGRSSTI